MSCSIGSNRDTESHDEAEEMEAETIEEAIFYHNYKEMKIDMERYDELEDEKDKDFTKLPSYMEGKCLEDIRLAFRIKSKMFRQIKMNNKKSYNNLVCDMCQSGRNESQCNGVSRLAGTQKWPGPGQAGGHGDLLQEDPGGQGQSQERVGSS